jgi:O-antigen biosynthesis protein
VLEQATDPDVFFPERDPTHRHDLVFVGNSRKVMRPILADLLPTERDLAVWGGDWDGLIDARHVVGTYLPNAEVRRAYSSAAIVLNDHWEDMRRHGFVSNRLYDAVACGALVISDRLDGVEERFGGAVVTYDGPGELRTIVEHFLAHPEERAARGAAGRELVLAQHTFAHRVDALLAHVDAARAAVRS